jgi:hypothetical protein
MLFLMSIGLIFNKIELQIRNNARCLRQRGEELRVKIIFCKTIFTLKLPLYNK